MTTAQTTQIRRNIDHAVEAHQHKAHSHGLAAETEQHGCGIAAGHRAVAHSYGRDSYRAAYAATHAIGDGQGC